MRSSGLGRDVQDAKRGIPSREHSSCAVAEARREGQVRYSPAESVFASGDPETGVSIHLVDAEYDRRSVIAQCRVAVLNGDTPATL
jgi:folate-dependent phosphoribosylglycinamide formyltransferase PurN